MVKKRPSSNMSKSMPTAITVEAQARIDQVAVIRHVRSRSLRIAQSALSRHPFLWVTSKDWVASFSLWQIHRTRGKTVNKSSFYIETRPQTPPPLHLPYIIPDHYRRRYRIEISTDKSQCNNKLGQHMIGISILVTIRNLKGIKRDEEPRVSWGK